MIITLIRKILISIILSLFILSISSAQSVFETRGPYGESPVLSSSVGMRLGDREKIRGLNLKAAILMHTDSNFSSALIEGAISRFNNLGVEVVLITNADFDADQQSADIERAISLSVDIIITLVLDPVSSADSLKKAVDKGIKIALLSNVPNGFVHGRDYVSIVTDDLFNMGKSVAEMMGETLGGEGNVIWLYHDADYYVTNQRDRAFRSSLSRLYPRMKIIAERGIVRPADSREIMADILEEHPLLNAVYAPWDSIAEGVVKALVDAGREDVKVFTMDLGREVSLDLAEEGPVAGIVVDLPFVIGETLALLACNGVLGNETPPFVVVPAVKVDRNNLKQMWQRAYRRDAPEEVLKALE